MKCKRVEVLYLGRNLAGEGGGIEAGDALRAALAGQQRLPGIVSVVAHSADNADAGYDDAAVPNYFDPFA